MKCPICKTISKQVFEKNQLLDIQTKFTKPKDIDIITIKLMHCSNCGLYFIKDN